MNVLRHHGTSSCPVGWFYEEIVSTSNSSQVASSTTSSAESEEPEEELQLPEVILASLRSSSLPHSRSPRLPIRLP
eukprot:4981969-Amphidinium_carterae.1